MKFGLIRSSKVFAIILCISLLGVIMHFRNPLRVAIPDKATAVSALQPQLSRLNDEDRKLVLGYLLRHREEAIPSFMRDDAVLDAKTFKEAIESQKVFLKKQGYLTPDAFLKRGLLDQMLRPLRQAVAVELIGREMKSRREFFEVLDGNATRHGNDAAKEEKTLLVVTYRVQNLTNREIDGLKGAVEIRKASYDSTRRLGLMTNCYVELEKLAPGSYRDVACSNRNRNNEHMLDSEFMEIAENDMHLIWTPHAVLFSDGEEIRFNDHKADSVLLWGFYRVN